jgi:hypothetical protein
MVEISYKALYFMKWPDAGKFGKLEMIGSEQCVRLGIYFGCFLVQCSEFSFLHSHYTL